ncbi:restriction endonuclease subunit S [Nitrospira moscoviensis]|uniref:Type I restriction-modification system DNA specificity subunit n=1 Tax=Nitrospira moscoviensis TaxID=42253 RepID=A0A0K2GBC3_NITMO|nr:restriction endonuclease subunit S [Nitrospira moscoviensis]ALA57887.1 Type I restriction-modification system DNA specificity subunit [Nitrospira moscoviensis]
MTAATWRNCKLGDLLEIKHGYAFQGEYFAGAGSHIVLTPGNFHDEGGFKDKGGKEKWYTGPVPSDYVLKEGDLIVAMTEQAEGLLGSSAIIPRSGLYLHNQRLGLVQVRDQSQADKRFLYYLFNSKPVRQQIRASASGTKIRHTAPSRIGEVKVKVPSLPVQHRIAGILSAYDDLISNNQRRIKILEEMARSLYREWFVHFRFPGHDKIKMVSSPLGHIPQGWEAKKLGDIADVNRAQINPRIAPDEVHYIDISSVSPGQIETVTTYLFSEAPGRARRIVQHGDILWSCVRPNRRSHALVMKPEPNTIASTGFAVLTTTKIPFTFLYLATTTDDFVTYLVNNATGAAYPAVTAKIFEDATLLVPTAPLLKKFGEATIPMAEQSNSLQRQNQNLRRTRNLLLPRLLSGQVDIRSTESIA